MTTQDIARTPSDERAMRVAASLFGAAAVAVGIALLAGLVLLVAEPEAGSTGGSALGIIAAVAGLATAVLVIAGLIYTQVKNLWRFMPAWLRMAAWAVIAVGVALTLRNWVSQVG